MGVEIFFAWWLLVVDSCVDLLFDDNDIKKYFCKNVYETKDRDSPLHRNYVMESNTK